MRFASCQIPGVRLVEAEKVSDDRGFFARTWCADEFERAGIASVVVQASVSYNARAGTLRGMHFSWPPACEGKLVRCTRGRVHDVLLDLRPSSPTFLRHVAVELVAEAHNAVYVPPGVAHGFQALEDRSEVFYMMTEAYRPDVAAGVRFDDPRFGIAWPLPVTVIADRDRGYPDFDLDAHRRRLSGDAWNVGCGDAR